MKNPIFLAIALTASTLTANAQSPADTLQNVRPFSTHALDLLVAREPGVEVISSPGAPGTTPTIHVRGISVSPGIQPVYVVDGMRRRNLDGIAPESIEKIEVLKNAAAMGLWGPEAAAGVVVVTTRRASQQGFHAGYEFAGGFQSLAYAPEIAAVMLQRQQASAIIDARKMIVDGAVGMVEMALDRLSENHVVELDEERKAAMVSNLLVVLCGNQNAQPVVNSGSLY